MSPYAWRARLYAPGAHDRGDDRRHSGALAEPSFHQTVVKAREAALKQNLMTMREMIDQFKADRGVYPASLAELKNAGYLKRIPVDPFTKSEATWQEIMDSAEGGIFDVHSGSDLVALDGRAYNQW